MKPTVHLAFLALLFLPACQQEMATQPAYRPLRPSSFFADGRSARSLVPGTVARGSKLADGITPIASADWARIVGVVGTISDNPLAAASRSAGWSIYRDTFPMPINQRVLERGQERFNIYCAMCHDRVGAGKGMVVERGFTAPPSYHTDWSRGFKRNGIDLKLRNAPVGYYFEVITHGFGAMPDYAEQVGADDRWAIIAYIRALQFSQRASLADVRDESESARLRLRKGAKAQR